MEIIRSGGTGCREFGACHVEVAAGKSEDTMCVRFACVWEFQVPPSMESEFRRHYGPDGSWARLFRQDPAYIETLLLNDRSTRGRYLTVDRWKTAEAYRSFRERFAEDYAALDRLCEALTGQEADLGSFMELDSEPAA